jgi:hypothetical protein
MRQRSLYDVEGRVDVCLHRRIKVFIGDFRDRCARLLAPRIAYKDVEAAEQMNRIFHQTTTKRRVSEIPGNWYRLSSRGLN